jgi:hypothetical protein
MFLQARSGIKLTPPTRQYADHFDAIQALIKPILNVKAIDTLDPHYKIFAIEHSLDMSIEVSHIR